MKTIVFNKKGMTLAETIVGVAVLSISLVIIVSTQLSIKNEMNKLDTKIKDKLAAWISNKINFSPPSTSILPCILVSNLFISFLMLN